MPRDRRDNWTGLLSFGFFITLFALFFLIVPGYGERVVALLKDFKIANVAPYVFLPAPGNLRAHTVVYETVMRFCLIFGFFQFVVLGLRLLFKSYLTEIAETISSAVFWLGAAYVFFLLTVNAVEWFPFIGGMIAIVGMSIIARHLVVLLFWRRNILTSLC